ncbi:hypothetical protein [Streptomyces sp. NPDC002994]|uniref:hypothetical protein n=1 Tax=Streptomyces sp. NPDC002994 TaxID=3154441 RepID=UPI0033B85010
MNETELPADAEGRLRNGITQAPVDSGQPVIVDYSGFTKRLNDPRRTRWRLLEEFQREWGHCETLGTQRQTGSREAVGTTPAALREWLESPCNAVTQAPELFDVQWLLPPSELTPETPVHADDVPADALLHVFLAEGQGCNYWAYPASHASRPDPAVLVDDDPDGDGPAWFQQSRSISEFALQLSAMHLPRKLGWVAGKPTIRPDTVARVAAAFPTMGFLPWREMAQHTKLYGARDAIVYVDHSRSPHREFDSDFPQLEIAARTQKALLDAGRALGLEWHDDEIGPPPEPRRRTG